MHFRRILMASAAYFALSGPLHAVPVTLAISGTTNEAEGTLTYTPGSAFSARFVFDGNFADTNTNVNVGSFFDFRNATTALLFAELTTELGAIRYEPGLVSAPFGTFLPPQVSQINAPDRESINIVAGGDPFGEAYSGALGSLVPSFLGLNLVAQGTGDFLFTDPNVLLSGAGGGLDDNPNFVGGRINVTQFGSIADFDETTLFFGAGEFSIFAGDGSGSTGGGGGVPPVTPVPLPASLPFLMAALAGLGFASRRTAQGA